MSPSRWQKLKEPFYAALDLSPEDRLVFLDKHFGDDAQSRAEIEALLLAHEQAGEFIESPAFEQLQPIATEPEPLTEKSPIGPYRLLRELGRGGMGVVYLAVRDDEVVKKQVAIKIIQAGVDTKTISQRFRTERQALATLEHPNIARFLDGGFTDDGRPYYVMEYVEGEPVHRFCDSHRLSIRQRLELFRQVCAAVHYAHQNLIVHRDLKPDNIMVTPSGVPKLLDFGIAKILKPELLPHTLMVTKERWQLMTPAYASPEQIRGDPITTTSDVYSLGVLLYELLTGHQPYRFKSRAPLELERVICEQQPERPSTAISRVEEVESPDGTTTTLTPETVSKTREGQPDKLRRQLAGDLDNIVMMAMRKEPQRRYASVEQFSEDIHRHLSGLPVIAHKDTLRYRTAKFVQRHRTGVIASALFVILLLASIVATSWQARVAETQRAKAERRFNDVRKLANALIFELHEAIKDLPGSTSARELLVSRALEYLDLLAREARDDPSLQLDLAIAYEKVGDVQGRPLVPNLGDLAGAEQSYRKALAIREELFAQNPTSREARRALAASYFRIADVAAWGGNIATGLEYYRKSLKIRGRLAGEAPGNVAFMHDFARTHSEIGKSLWWSGKTEEARQSLYKAQDLLESLAKREPANVEIGLDLGICSIRIADIIAWDGDSPEALIRYRKALARHEELARHDPNHTRVRRGLWLCYSRIGENLPEVGDLEGALASYRKGLTIAQKMAEEDPSNSQARRDVAMSHGWIGDALVQLNRPTEALESYHANLAIQKSLLELNPKMTEIHRDLGSAYLRLGEASFALNKLNKAIDYYVKGTEVNEKLVAMDPQDAPARTHVALSYSYIAKVHKALAQKKTGLPNERIKNWQQALDWYTKSLNILTQQKNEGSLFGFWLQELDKVAAEAEACEAALVRLKE
jgi:non-specific serine/threonine protein kinase/serine/threonine-protein kinase